VPPSAVVAIGASTGGPEAIRSVVGALPADLDAAVVIAQHMPAGFTRAFAERLDQIGGLEVREARHHDVLRSGLVLIAPGQSHMLVRRREAGLFVELTRGPGFGNHRPSVDALLSSVARAVGERAIGLVLTGMGADGAEGLLAIHLAGGLTLAQDEATSVVYGMPRAALDQGGAQRVLPLGEIPRALGQLLARHQGGIHVRESTAASGGEGPRAL